jgi:hypothetical protein
MRLPLASLAEASTNEKVRFAADASNSRDAVAGERRAADAERDIRGFAPGWPRRQQGCRRQQAPPIVDGSHDELSARSMT